MDKVILKGTELKVSPIALGTDSYGLLTNEEESYALLDEFFSLGGNLLDTAEAIRLAKLFDTNRYR